MNTLNQPQPIPTIDQKNKNISGKNVQSSVFRPSSCRRDKFQKGQVLGGNVSSRFSDFGGIKKDSNPKKTGEVVNTKKAEVSERTGRFFMHCPTWRSKSPLILFRNLLQLDTMALNHTRDSSWSGFSHQKRLCHSIEQPSRVALIRVQFFCVFGINWGIERKENLGCVFCTKAYYLL